MRNILRIASFLAVALLIIAQSARSQTAVFTKSVIDSNPPDAQHLEKAIGYFTSTAYPSYYLGTTNGGYIYDTHTSQRITVDQDGYHYERARTFLYPGDTYPGIIASVGPVSGEGQGQTIWYQNPANWDGGDPTQPWGKQVILNSWCHDIRLADFDGDGKMDVACSGTNTYADEGDTVARIAFQNNYNSWTEVDLYSNAGDGIAIFDYNGRPNIVGVSGTTLSWYENPGGAAARNGANWVAHTIGPGTIGTSLVTLNVGSREIVVQASNESGNDDEEVWPPGLVYFDPGSNPYGAWYESPSIDDTYRDVHEIDADTLGGIPFITVGEQSQASSACNADGINDHPTVSGCRVAVFPWTGSGFGAPTLLADLGTQNQTLLQVNGTEYLLGANHDAFNDYDIPLYLWTFTFGASGSQPGAPSNLVATAVSSSEIDLSWTASPTSGVTYSVFRSQTSGFTPGSSNQIASGISGLTYNDTGLSASTTYYYLAEAVDSAGSSGASNPANATTGPGTSQLANGTYTITSGSSAVDGGFGYWGETPPVQFYQATPGNTYQQWQWNGSTFQNVGYSGHFLADNGDGTVTETSTGDTWTATSVSGGYTLQDNRTQNYLSNNSGVLAMSGTATAWTVQQVNGGGGGGNLIQDPGFESSTSLSPYWNVDGSPTGAGVDTTATHAHAGTNSGSVYDQTSNQSFVDISQTVSVAANTTYTLTGWIDADNTTGGLFGVRTTGGANIGTTAINNTDPGPETHSADYQQYTVTFNSGSNTSVVVFAGYTTPGTPGSFINVDDTSLAVGGGTDIVAIDAGGVGAGNYAADEDYSNSSGSTFSISNAIDTSGVFDPAPQEVYQSQRWGGVTYTIPNLTADATYIVRLHFTENTYTSAGQRQFNALINGTQVLTNFDVFAAAGAEYKAITEDFIATASASGQIVIQFTNGTSGVYDPDPIINGIEIQQ